MKRRPIIHNGKQIGWEEFEEVKIKSVDTDIFSGLRKAIQNPIIKDEKETIYGKCDKSGCGKILDKNKSIKAYHPFGMKGVELWFCCKDCEDRWYANMHG